MLTEKETTRISKFLSLVLRHQPETINLQLDENGWALVNDLLQNMKAKDFDIDKADLQHIVDTNNKKRFAFSEDGTRIRASQGHSVEVDLGYEKMTPPPILYHGTAQRNIASILEQGLQKKARQHVHLSTSKETALQVGSRHGIPIVLEVLAGEMHRNDFAFYFSANGVWLTDNVPAIYIRQC